MNKIVIPTGYMGSGSSAVTDLLSEVKGYNCKNENFEYVFMHCPDGLFDLEDKLLIGNNALRCDEALHSFYDCMNQLYLDKHYWVADYKHKIHADFIKCCEVFIDSLIDERLPKCYWYYQEKNSIHVFIQRIINIIVSFFSFGKIPVKPALQYNEMWISYPSQTEFYTEAKKFLNCIFIKMGIGKSNLVLDQLLLPHNLYRMDYYFDGNCKVIVVERDPRDVFLLNKYYWNSMNTPIPYPLDVKSFCTYYYKMRECEKKYCGANVLRIHFEDLVYFYKKTVREIFDFLDISECDHTRKFTKLIPEKSALNTQLFNRDHRFEDEAKYIEDKLSTYIYTFPRVMNEGITEDDVIL